MLISYFFFTFLVITLLITFFFTFLHPKSKKKVNDEMLDTDEKVPNDDFLLKLCFAPSNVLNLLFFFIRK